MFGVSQVVTRGFVVGRRGAVLPLLLRVWAEQGGSGGGSVAATGSGGAATSDRPMLVAVGNRRSVVRACPDDVSAARGAGAGIVPSGLWAGASSGAARAVLGVWCRAGREARGRLVGVRLGREGGG